MATEFTTTGEWQGSIKGGYQTAVKVAGFPAPQSGYIYRRARNVSDRWRWGQGLLSWVSIAGTTVFGDDLDITNGPDTTNWGGEPDYIVTANNLDAAPPGSGIWKETMVAEGYTDWEEWLIPII
jgi:hypothetical protein